jgi:hypothetical protein
MHVGWAGWEIRNDTSHSRFLPAAPAKDIEGMPATGWQWCPIDVLLETKDLLSYREISHFELRNETVDKCLKRVCDQPLAVLISPKHDHLPVHTVYMWIQIDPKVVAALVVSEGNPQWIGIQWFDPALWSSAHRISDRLIHVHEFGPYPLKREHPRERQELEAVEQALWTLAPLPIVDGVK